MCLDPQSGLPVAECRGVILVEELHRDVTVINAGADSDMTSLALHRMERRGWIESDWGVSENNRRAKYYQLKPKGRKALRDETSTWHRYVEAVGMLLQLERPEPA